MATSSPNNEAANLAGGDIVDMESVNPGVAGGEQYERRVGFKAGVKEQLLRVSAKLSAKRDSLRKKSLREDIAFQEHIWPLEELYLYYGLDPTQGLSAEQVAEQRGKFGENRLTPPVVVPAWLQYLRHYANFFVAILLLGAVLCFVAYGISQDDASNLYLGAILVVVVIISSTFAYLQEAKSAKIMESFKHMMPKKCTCIRDGTPQILEAWELVPGDLVELNAGDQVPADMRIVAGSELKLDNSSLTGESELQERGPELSLNDRGERIVATMEANNLAFFTTLVAAGHGKGVVLYTGDKTVMGQIAGLAGESAGKGSSAITLEINKFIKLVSVFAIILGIVFVLVGTFAAEVNALEMVVFGIGIIVGTVPEGLLMTLTVGLAVTARRLSAKHMLVKNLLGVETLGSTTLIASDKTGTLTQNRMTVRHCWFDGRLHSVPIARNRPQREAAMKEGPAAGEEPIYDADAPTFKQLHAIASLCNNSRFTLRDPLDDAAPTLDLPVALDDPDFDLLGLECTGDASETALLKFVELLRDTEEYRRACPKLFEIKFNSTNKWQLSIHKPEDRADPHPLLLLKGAPERVLRRCKKILIDGKEVPFDEEWAQRYVEAYEGLGSRGERVLGFAYRRLTGLPLDHPFAVKPRPNFPSDGLTFAGLVSLMDPPREGVLDAVGMCHTASVKVFMVTGDHPLTAQAIAKQVGIISDAALESGQAAVYKGDDIREWMELGTPEEQQAKWDAALDHRQIVWARVSPAHKLLIVENAQRRGEVVAVTGDGVNDAPALNKADIGVAMGIAGKDVAKESADIVLTDDNFASIVHGIEEGRLIFDNLKKSIAYVLGSKLPQQIPFVLFILFNFPLALTTILILCLDLGTDLIPAISLAYERKEADIMARPPRRRGVDRLVTAKLVVCNYVIIGILTACGGILGFLLYMSNHGYRAGAAIGVGLHWDEHPLLGLSPAGTSNTTAPEVLGYGCGAPVEFFDGRTTMFGASQGSQNPYCENGCQVDFEGRDPFTEFSVYGFRGHPNFGPLQGSYPSDAPGDVAGRPRAEVAVCGRTCDWWTSLSSADKDTLFAAHDEYVQQRTEAGGDPTLRPASPLALVLSREEDELFASFCQGQPAAAANGMQQAPYYGFPGRSFAVSDTIAEAGSLYWYDGSAQLWPNLGEQRDTLRVAQTAYFIGVFVARFGHLIISKTRKLSIIQQGLLRNKQLNYAILYEACVAVALVYIPPLNTVFGTLPIPGPYWLCGLPFLAAIVLYDEARRALLRRYPDSILRYTYW